MGLSYRNTAREPTARRLACSLIAGVLAALGATARADEIETVNLTASGPDRELPVGKPFYVGGTAAETTQSVQAIVVRKGSPVIAFGGPGPSCLELRNQLGRFSTKAAPKPAAPGASELATLDADYAVLEPGTRKARSIWAHGDGLALVTAAWQRGTAKDAQPFKLLVPGDGGLFQAGYAFCLYVFRVDRTEVSVADDVGAALASYERAVASCTTPTCADDASNALSAAIAAMHIDAARVVRLDKAALSFQRDPDAIRYMLKSWRANVDPTAKPGPSFVKRVDLPVLIPLAPRPPATRPGQTPPAPDPAERHIPLAGALATLLSRHPGGLIPMVDHAGNSRSVSYYTLTGKTRVARLGLLDDGSLEVSEGTAATTSPVKAKLDDLALSPTVSARDVVEFTQGRLRLGGYKPLKAIAADLERSLKAGNGASQDELANLSAFRTGVEGLAEAMRRAFAASAGFVCESHSYPAGARLPDTAERALGEWLRCEVVESCGLIAADWSKHTHASLQSCSTTDPEAPAGCSTAEPNPKAWPGCALIGTTPLDTLAIAAADLLDAHDTWSKAKTSLATSRISTHEERSETRLAFTQETWVGSYVTPVVGYARAAASTLFYTAFQLHLVPNPVDDPQWSHGIAADLSRAFAIEIGFAPDAGSFGPDGRYDGPSILPPLFFGAALHPLPYTSIGAGWMLADARSTTLAKQDRHIEAFGYLGLSLQGNLPDLLYKKLGYGFKTSTDK